jgi:DNA-directed RNA polymerase alpha subunit
MGIVGSQAGFLGIEELELSARAYNVLKRMDVHTFYDLVRVSAQDLSEWTHTYAAPY